MTQDLSIPVATVRSTDCRSEARFPAMRAADLVFSDVRTPIACLVSEISNSGLKLLIDSPHKLPDLIKLVLSHPHREHLCKVAWRREKEVGLQIVD